MSDDQRICTVSDSHYITASEETIKYTPTTDLRFVKRPMELVYVLNTITVRVLQQRFVGSDGSERWIDVPEVDET